MGVETKAQQRVVTLDAVPNPVPAGLGLGSTRISWDTGDGSIGQIYVSRGDASEDLFATGSGGCVEATWIAEGSSYLFRLYGGTTHERVVAEVTVTRRALSWQMLSEEVIRYASRDEHTYDVAELLSKLLPRYAYPPAYQRYFHFWKQHGYVSAHPDRFAGISYLTGECNVCGNHTAFFSDSVGLYREALTCAECLTTSRYRSIARGLLRAIRELTGVQAESLSELNRKHGMRRLSVYDTQVPFYAPTNAYPIPEILSRCSWIDTQVSAYVPSYPWGTSLDPRTSNQNLERLSFPDNSFDIVITSDVMEHVRLDGDAHSEIRRVLKPGGVYIFTVPHFRHQRETLVRVAVTDPSDPSKDVYLMEREYHGDANSEEDRALVYRVYGTDLDEILNELGFEVEYEKQDDPQHAIMNTELFYCLLRK